MKPELSLFALALVPRLVFLLAAGVPDENYFWRLSTGLLTTGRFTDEGVLSTRFTPAYPAFLAAARWVTGDRPDLVQLIQVVVAALGAVILYRLALRLSADRPAATLAAIAYACYPYLVRQSIAWESLTLYTVALLAAVYAFTRVVNWRTAAVAGAAFGFAFLVRSTVLPLWLLAVADLFVTGARRAALVVTAVTILVIAPYLVRNYRIDGSLVETRHGESLFVANCEYSDRFIPTYDVDFLVPYAEARAREQAGLDPRASGEAAANAIDDAEAELAWEFIKAHPWRTLRLRLLNVLYLFHPRIVPFVPWGPGGQVVFLPDGGFRVESARTRGLVQELAHTVSYSAIALVAIVGVMLRRRELFRRDRILSWTVLSFVVVYSIYFPTTRLRMPMEFVLMFYAGCAVSPAAGRWWSPPAKR